MVLMSDLARELMDEKSHILFTEWQCACLQTKINEDVLNLNLYLFSFSFRVCIVGTQIGSLWISSHYKWMLHYRARLFMDVFDIVLETVAYGQVMSKILHNAQLKFAD
jgi:hypothetical protein